MGSPAPAVTASAGLEPEWSVPQPIVNKETVRYVIVSFLIGLLLYLSVNYQIWTTGLTAPLWLRLAVLAAASATQLLRFRPVAAAIICLIPVAIDGVFGGTVPVLLVFVDHLHSATVNGSHRTSRIIVRSVGVVTVVISGIAVVTYDNWSDVVLVILQASGLILPVRWALNVRRQRESADAERLGNLQLSRMAELDRNVAIVRERTRLARDLHDAVAGHLTGIAIQAEALLTSVDRDPEMVRKIVRLIRENSVLSLAEMRSMIDVLREDEPDPATSPARLGEIDGLLQSARAGGLRVESTVELKSDPGVLPTAVDLSAYRIVQEALTNAVKHAPGAKAWLTVSDSGGRVTIDLINEVMKPRGSRAAAGGGVGLDSMRERARLLGGSLTAGRCEEGWRVYAVLPGERALT
ncbi:histidine kinase [Amycolatopsis sp. NPDC051071]|uniref:sensor histidine kinase n=1 Tax=Amycolatopsis sp. NPDC051071 TaxID=3154637 RepID=UPI003428D445